MRQTLIFTLMFYMIVSFTLEKLEAVSDLPSENVYITGEKADKLIIESRAEAKTGVANIIEVALQAVKVFSVFALLISFQTPGMPFLINTLIMVPLGVSVILVFTQLIRGSSN